MRKETENLEKREVESLINLRKRYYDLHYAVMCAWKDLEKIEDSKYHGNLFTSCKMEIDDLYYIVENRLKDLDSSIKKY